MKPQTHKLNLTTEEATDIRDVLIEHQRGYGTEHTPERIVRIRKVIDQLTNLWGKKMDELQRYRLKLDIIYVAREIAKGRNGDNEATVDDILTVAERFFKFVTNQ